MANQIYRTANLTTGRISNATRAWIETHWSKVTGLKKLAG